MHRIIGVNQRTRIHGNDFQISSPLDSPIAGAGAKTAASKTIAVTVTGGKLTLSLKSVVGNAILSGLVLYPA